MSLEENFDKDVGKEGVKPKDPPVDKKPDDDKKDPSDTFTIDIKDSTKDDATNQALLAQQKKIEELEKKAAKSEAEKDNLEKKQLLEQIEALNYKTKSLKDQPLSVVKAVAATLKESGKDIVFTTKKTPTHKGRNITHVVDGKRVPWVDRYAELKKDD